MRRTKEALMSNATQSVQFPVANQVFPEVLKRLDSSPDGVNAGNPVILGKSFSCQACEHRFYCQENDPNDKTKKSKSWAVGFLIWGTQDPSLVECFMVKCTSCGQPAMILPLTKRKKASELIKMASSPLPNPKQNPTQPAEVKPLPIEINKPKVQPKSPPTVQKAPLKK